MTRKQRRELGRRPLLVPRPLDPGNRQPIGVQAVRAAYAAHKSSAHDGDLSTNCVTCRSYLLGVSVAAAQAQEQAGPAPS